MSEIFKFGDDKNKQQQEQPIKAIENYSTPGQTRNLCFVLVDGKMLFLNYGYLVSGEYSVEEDTITLSYTTHIITVKGQNLATLFTDLSNHLPKIISATDKRYKDIVDKKGNIMVFELPVQSI